MPTTSWTAGTSPDVPTWSGGRRRRRAGRTASCSISPISRRNIEGFNQSRVGGLWGELEDAILEEVEVGRLRLTVMAGPLLTDRDPSYRGVESRASSGR